MSDRVAIMRDGRIEQLGAPREVYERPATAFVAEFVGASNRLPATIVAVPTTASTRPEADGVGRFRAAGVPGLERGQSPARSSGPRRSRSRPAAADRAGVTATSSTWPTSATRSPASSRGRAAASSR